MPKSVCIQLLCSPIVNQNFLKKNPEKKAKKNNIATEWTPHSVVNVQCVPKFLTKVELNFTRQLIEYMLMSFFIQNKLTCNILTECHILQKT